MPKPIVFHLAAEEPAKMLNRGRDEGCQSRPSVSRTDKEAAVTHLFWLSEDASAAIDPHLLWVMTSLSGGLVTPKLLELCDDV